MQRNNFSYNLCVFSLMLLAPWQNGSCRSGKTETMLKEQNRVATGNWGGQNVQMDVTADGAQLRFNCARGSIEQPIVLDTEGRFSAKGTFVAGVMGPLHEDNPPKSQPAIYSGTVKDQSMTLTVTIPENKEEGGTFSLEHGKPGRIWRCH
jgi:hypothetical protein